MTVYVIPLCTDVAKDADLYAIAKGFHCVKNLKAVKAGDTAILYTHGTWDGTKEKPWATNTIVWGKQEKNGAEAALALITELQLTPSKGITVIVHACFSAGTREVPPTFDNRLNTFAGKLCASLGGEFPGVKVLGYQGKAKVGFAGYFLNAEPNWKERSSRRNDDPHEGANYAVAYAFDTQQKMVIIQGQGKHVVWEERGERGRSVAPSASSSVSSSTASSSSPVLDPGRGGPSVVHGMVNKLNAHAMTTRSRAVAGKK